MTTAAVGEANATSRADGAGPATRSIWACLGAATQHNPVLKAFYDRLVAKGKEKQGGADRLHAQADLHPQCHDRPASEVGRQPVCRELIERELRARSVTERLQSQQTGERTGSRP